MHGCDVHEPQIVKIMAPGSVVQALGLGQFGHIVKCIKS